MASIQDVYNALTKAGASRAQALGIIGNAISETGGKSLTAGINTQYYRPDCMGFLCWTAPYYNPPRPTGNDLADLEAQVAYLVHSGGISAASGTDPCSAAQAFATGFEKCAECGPGGAEFNARCKQANDAANAVSGAGGTGVAAAGDPCCVIKMPLFGGCLITRGEIKALTSGFIILAGVVLMAGGVIVLGAFALKHTRAGRGALSALNTAGRVPGLGKGAAALHGRASRRDAQDEADYKRQIAGATRKRTIPKGESKTLNEIADEYEATHDVRGEFARGT